MVDEDDENEEEQEEEHEDKYSGGFFGAGFGNFAVRDKETGIYYRADPSGKHGVQYHDDGVLSMWLQDTSIAEGEETLEWIENCRNDSDRYEITQDPD